MHLIKLSDGNIFCKLKMIYHLCYADNHTAWAHYSSGFLTSFNFVRLVNVNLKTNVRLILKCIYCITDSEDNF